MEWECAWGMVNSQSSLACEACGWTRDYSERYKSGSLPKMTDEEQRIRDKSTLKKEIVLILTVMGLSIIVIFLSNSLCRMGVIDDGIVIILVASFPIFIIGCLITITRLLWREQAPKWKANISECRAGRRASCCHIIHIHPRVTWEMKLVPISDQSCLFQHKVSIGHSSALVKIASVLCLVPFFVRRHDREEARLFAASFAGSA